MAALRQGTPFRLAMMLTLLSSSMCLTLWQEFHSALERTASSIIQGSHSAETTLSLAQRILEGVESLWTSQPDGVGFRYHILFAVAAWDGAPRPGYKTAVIPGDIHRFEDIGERGIAANGMAQLMSCSNPRTPRNERVVYTIGWPCHQGGSAANTAATQDRVYRNALVFYKNLIPDVPSASKQYKLELRERVYFEVAGQCWNTSVQALETGEPVNLTALAICIYMQYPISRRRPLTPLRGVAVFPWYPGGRAELGGSVAAEEGHIVMHYYRVWPRLPNLGPIHICCVTMFASHAV